MVRKILLILLAFIAGFNADTIAQTPGGVPVAAWYKAEGLSLFSDAGITQASNNSTIQQWNEFQGTGRNLLQAYAGSRPVFSNATTLANFNPTVTFDGSNDWMQYTAAGNNIIDRTNGTLYAAGYKNTHKRSGFTGFHASMDFPGLHVFQSDNKLLFFTSGGPGYQGKSIDAMEAKSFFAAGSSWLNGITYASTTLSLNGLRNDYSGSEVYNVNNAAAYNDFRIGADNNYGSFDGQLNEIMVFEDRLTSAQMSQVETYLAIKYGTTHAKGTEDYVNSTGGTVWSQSANTGFHHNIAGIARDDNGALYQKQSWSTNTGQQVLIGVGDLANTNAANAGVLTDGTYLIWGDNGENKAPTVPISSLAGINYHFGSIWKVQQNGAGTVRIAWPKGFTDLTLIQSTDAVIGSGDVTTGMTANEITINGVVYNYADAVLEDGSFFTFGAQMATPGGISANLRVWLRSDAGFAPHSWTDLSGNGNHFTQTNTNRQPFTAAQSFNFNPIIDFGGSASADGRFMVVPAGQPFTANGLNGTFFMATLTREGGTSGYRDIWGFGGTTTTANLTDANLPTITKLYNDIVLYNTITSAFPGKYPNNKLLLTDVSYTVGVSGIQYGLNGNVATTSQTRPAVYSLQANGSILGSQPQVMNGLIGEAIAFERDLTEAEKIRVRSYIAIKYGMTLAHDYIASDGTTIVWNQTGNTGYNNNIAGLARDNNSDLHQKQSNSIETGQQVLIGTTGLNHSNAANPTGITEGSFLMWGDNGLAKVPAVSVSGVAGVNYRFASVWKVQNTGSVGTVRVAWPQGLTNTTLLVNTTDPAFATVDASYAMTGTVVVNGSAYNYADVALNDGDYFTFASQLNGPGGVSLDLRVWLRADAGFTPDSWTDFSGNENHYTQTNLNRQPFTAAQSFNFNPIIDFGGSASADGRFMVVPSGKPFSANGLSGTFLTATLTRTGGTSGYRDIWGFGGTTTTANLTGADIPTITKLNNDIVLYSSTTSAFPGQYPDNKLLLTDVSYTVGVSGIKYGLNGNTSSTTQTRIAGLSLQANGSILGSQPEVMNGLMGEAIAYERDLTEDEKVRVRSYVAIKYGITLPHNYVAADGTTVFWDIDGNDGYNSNIAGIVRDDYGSLYQRQSNSNNTGRQVLISTTSLNNSNATNTGSLEDQQFLVWGDNNAAKGPAVPITGIADVNSRFAAIWKVQNTNTVGTVRVAWPKGFNNLVLIQSADDEFTAADIVTPLSASQMVNGVEYAYADVTLTDGQYFTFAAFVQAPGGVTTGLSHWYRADKLVVIAEGVDSTVTAWTDFTSGVTSEQINGAPLPKYKSGNAEYFNFNPGINFTAINQMLGNIEVQTLNSLDYDIFSLTKEGMTGGDRYFNIGMNNTTLNGLNWDQPGLYFNGNIARRTSSGALNYFANPGLTTFSTTQPSIMYHTFTDVSLSKGLNGAPNGTTATHAAIGGVTGGHMFGTNGPVTLNPPAGDDWGFIGNIGELVIYGNGTITAAERNKVDAYLAIKYGVTLHNTQNYTTSGDVVVWDAAANSSYYNNVAGIGHDFISALHQKQSRSQQANANKQVVIGLGEIAATNAENIHELADGQFLMWGDNGNTQAMSNLPATYTPLEFAGSTDNGRRMNRVWKVQNTNVSDEVLIRFPRASVGTTTLIVDDCADYVIIYASDEAFTSNLVAMPLSLNEEDEYETLHTFPNGTSYFTYARVTPMNSGVVYLPETVETEPYSASCGTGDWSYFRLTANPSLKLFAASEITTTELNELSVTITPEGVTHEANNIHTSIMPRITTVTDATNGTYTGVKVRVYYSAEEMAATQVPGAITNGWFKYSGDAEELLIDIYGDGVFDPEKAILLTPAASGVEDGVNYVEFHNITSFSSFVYLSSTETVSVILPVHLSQFTAKAQAGSVQLDWTTASETNNYGFEIERSSDARNWSRIAFVGSRAANGNSTSKQLYTFVDNAPMTGHNYYRLKQVDFDGKYVHSQVQHVMILKSGSTITLAPNPVVNELKLSGLKDNSTITVTNSFGQILSKVPVKKNGEYVLDMSGYKSGVYFIRIEAKGGEVTSHKIIKQ